MILWANYNGIPNFKRSACSVFCGSCLFNSSVFLAARIELCFVNDDVVPWFPCHKGFHDTNIAIFLLVVVVGRFFHTFQEPRKKQKTKKRKKKKRIWSFFTQVTFCSWMTLCCVWAAATLFRSDHPGRISRQAAGKTMLLTSHQQYMEFVQKMKTQIWFNSISYNGHIVFTWLLHGVSFFWIHQLLLGCSRKLVNG